MLTSITFLPVEADGASRPGTLAAPRPTDSDHLRMTEHFRPGVSRAVVKIARPAVGLSLTRRRPLVSGGNGGELDPMIAASRHRHDIVRKSTRGTYAGTDPALASGKFQASPDAVEPLLMLVQAMINGRNVAVQ